MTSASSSPKTRRFDVIVIGAGFAGLSTAYHLAARGAGKIIVLEQAPRLGAHASGNNAGMIRQAIAEPRVAALAREGRASLQKAQSNGFGRFAFRSSGSLLLGGRRTPELTAIERTLRRQRVGFKHLTRAQAVRKVPALAEARFERGLFCPSDASVDIDRLLAGFVRALEVKKIPLLYGHRIGSIQNDADGFKVLAGGRTFHARSVVNAAGAWASGIGALAKASKIPFKAYRRHLFFTDRYDKRSARWPFVWDLENAYYFRPIDGALLLSPCDKQTGPADTPAARRMLARKLKKYSPGLAAVRIDRFRAGLRTMTPDGRFVIGEDPKLKNFFWVAGLGGHGVTTCFSVGRLAADLIKGRPVPAGLRDAFSPMRFARGGAGK